MPAFPRTVLPFEVSEFEVPGPLISKAQSGRVNIRSTQQAGRTWTERFLVQVSSIAGKAFLATVRDYWRNGTIFTISHRDYLIPKGSGGGSPVVNAATQLITYPEAFGSWAATGTPVLTTGQSDPLGGTAATLLSDDDGAGDEYITLAITFTGNGSKCIAIFMKQGTSSVHDMQLVGTATRHRVRVTWTDGVPLLSTITGAGALYATELVAPGWWRIPFGIDNVVAGETNTLFVTPTDFVPASTGTVYIFGANAWNEVSPARYAGPSQVASVTGSSLYINGATASQANWLRAGDIFRIAGVSATYEVTTDITTQANGYAVLPINPPLFTGGEPADNAALTVTGVTLDACILEPPTFPTTSGRGADWGECVIKFSETL